MKRFVVLVAFFAIVAAHRDVSNQANGCAPAPPQGYEVSISEEFAVISWDPNTKLEHFTRVANFDTDAPDFGFLVPTPTEPTLTEVDGARLAGVLKRITRRRVRYETKYVTKYGLGPFPDLLGRAGVSDTAAAPNGGVEVLGRHQVAGYEASILRAENADDLKAWLDDNNYPTTESIADWLKIYTEQSWIITAFKLSSPDEKGGVKTRAVRMSFQTDTPFYPYREPNRELDSKTGPRELRVFLLSDARYQGRVGKDGGWPAKTEWSGPMPDYRNSEVARAMQVEESSLPHWLTEFIDRSSPRNGFDELYFDKSATQATVERPVKINTYEKIRYFPGWGGAFLIAMIASPVLLVVGVIAFRRRRPKSDVNASNDESASGK